MFVGQLPGLVYKMLKEVVANVFLLTNTQHC